MWSYLRLHESFVTRALAGEYGDISLAQLRRFHERQLARLQHERLIHLLVTLFVATFLLRALGFASTHWTWQAIALVALLLVLGSAYVLHYFRLENGVQRLYHLANRIDAATGEVSALYADGVVVFRG